jgi:TonB-dependent SusC/RagA subfamily outer membrane receptor
VKIKINPAIMKNEIFLLMLLLLIASAKVDCQRGQKSIVVSGSVTYINNAPVAGALILADRKQTEVSTNRKGLFKIRVEPDIRMIGVYSEKMGSREMPLEGRTEINIVLDGTFPFNDFIPIKKEKDEMINVGYGSMKKTDLTTAPGQISGKTHKYDSYTSIYEMISGEVPGVQVTGKQITIRGISSINSSTDPLLVVDGTPTSSIDNINPRDVKTITLLKGSDASIYGSRGANGVILIDLKGAGD